MLDKETIWALVRENLAENLTDQNIKLWINPLQPLRIQGEILYLGCPNRFFMAWVKEHYFTHITAALSQAHTSGFKLKSIELELAPPAGSVKPKPPVQPEQIELPRLEVHKKAPLRFNPRFTFDRFVVGAPNQYAYSAAMAMANDWDINTDSLFLMSEPGLGKSHLSQAIGHQLLSRNPRSQVYYLTAEDFTNEMVYSLKNKRVDEFKNKYRQGCDVLVLEEVNFLSGKEKVQTELSYTLDCLLDAKKKIIFTSSKRPKDIPRLGRQFASRLNSSLMSTIEPPDFETRLSILGRKAQDNGLVIANSVLDFLARRIIKDVRQMESCLLSLNAQSRLLSRPVDTALVEEVLGDLMEEPGGFTPKIIQELVCRYFQVTLDDLRSRSRRKTVVMTRNVGMYLCRHLTDLSLEAIGQAFDRNHSTVLYACNCIENRSRSDIKLKTQLEFLSSQLKRAN